MGKNSLKLALKVGMHFSIYGVETTVLYLGAEIT